MKSPSRKSTSRGSAIAAGAHVIDPGHPNAGPDGIVPPGKFTPYEKPSRVSVVPILKEASQTWLDVGCGGSKQPHSVGMDKRALPGVDVVHDLKVFPWPFEPDTFSRIVMSHVMEHVNPEIRFDVMDEMWRVMKVDGILMLAMPYAGSHGNYQDPTHYLSWNETTPLYFDPESPQQDPGCLYSIYRPKPWKIEGCAWRNDGNIEIIMKKRGEK